MNDKLSELLSRPDVSLLSDAEYDYLYDATHEALATRHREGGQYPVEATQPLLEAALDMATTDGDRPRWFAAVGHFWRTISA